MNRREKIALGLSVAALWPFMIIGFIGRYAYLYIESGMTLADISMEKIKEWTEG